MKKSEELFALCVGMVVGFILGAIMAATLARASERLAWAEGRMKVAPLTRTVEEWHPPLRPGNAGWWEVAK
jgi:hypothetical protein